MAEALLRISNIDFNDNTKIIFLFLSLKMTFGLKNKSDYVIRFDLSECDYIRKILKSGYYRFMDDAVMLEIEKIDLVDTATYCKLKKGRFVGIFERFH